jgi:Polyketide cyclase / dehydrase and lipid transport
MRADTRTISIEAPAHRVVAFLEDPGHLPRWAVGFAKAVRQTPDGWVVQTGAGEIGLRIDADARRGTVDFWLSPAPGVEVLAALRVVPRGAGSEFVFTQFQPPDMSDEAFAASVQTLTHELTVLKALMEVACPL